MAGHLGHSFRKVLCIVMFLSYHYNSIFFYDKESLANDFERLAMNEKIVVVLAKLMRIRILR